MEITTGVVAQYQVEGETLQSVPWSIKDGATVLQEGSQSFPLSATADEVKAFLTQTLQVYQDDAARHAEASVRQAELDAAAQVASELSNITITA